MTCRQSCTGLCIAGKHLAVGFRFSYGIDTAHQMGSCCLWVMLKLLVWLEGCSPVPPQSWGTALSAVFQ